VFPRPRGPVPCRPAGPGRTEASARRRRGGRWPGVWPPARPDPGAALGQGRWSLPKRAGGPARLSLRSGSPCARHVPARRLGMDAVAGQPDPVAGRVAQTGATASGTVLRAQVRAICIGLRAALGRQGCHPAHTFRRRLAGLRKHDQKKRACHAVLLPVRPGTAGIEEPYRMIRNRPEGTAERKPARGLPSHRSKNATGRRLIPV